RFVSRLAFPVERDLVARARLDVAIDAVEANVELAAEVPLRVRRLPPVQLGERLEPRQPLPSLAVPELLERDVVDVGLGVGACAPGGGSSRWRGRSRLEVVRVRRGVRGPALSDEDVILEPHAAVPLPVETRLDRDAVAGDELLVAEPAEARCLVHLEADAVA